MPKSTTRAIFSDSLEEPSFFEWRGVAQSRGAEWRGIAQSRGAEFI